MEKENIEEDEICEGNMQYTVNTMLHFVRRLFGCTIPTHTENESAHPQTGKVWSVSSSQYNKVLFE